MEFDYRPEYVITNETLDLAVQITERLTTLQALDNLFKQPQLRRVNRLRTIHSSLAIENNSLTFEQVTAVINGKTVIAPQNEILEVKNAYEAYTLLEETDPFSITDTLKIHGVMMKGLAAEAGKFRTAAVGVFSGGRPVHIAPPPQNVPALIRRLYDWVKTEKLNELIKYSVFHYEFEFIHPFGDGNGRMGRFLQTAFLAKWKPLFAYIPVETVIKERQREYYDAFRACCADGGKSTRFIVFMLKALLSAVRNIHNDSADILKSQTAQIQKLLEILGYIPLSAQEIGNRLGLKSLSALRVNYLTPALELGLIAMSLPDKPTSKNQKYYKAGM
ncbi:MAG: Fic family protein [Clostridiales bacterium]|jgi:Fic family protein|nr:Fic family protein [Clostridiales bacterium]